MPFTAIQRDLEIILGVPPVAQWKQVRLGSTRMWVQSLALLSELRIWHCRELWCRSQTWLGSCVAVAVVQTSRCSSTSTPSLGTSKCHRSGPRKDKMKNKNKNKKQTKKWITIESSWHSAQHIISITCVRYYSSFHLTNYHLAARS